MEPAWEIFDAPGNTIGGTTPESRNIISGNMSSGINVERANAVGNLIRGNYIGIDAGGSQAVGNRWGISLYGPSNIVGGVEPGAGNVISANDSDGVAVYGETNQILGNLIGTNADGTSSLGNGGNGVIMGSENSSVGNGTAQGRNIISGNALSAVFIDNYHNGNTVSGNYLGVDITGSLALGNGESGVSIRRSSSAVVVGNVISANLVGITLREGPNTIIRGNMIGTDATGLVDLGNTSHGISLLDPGSVIGGVLTGEGNLISGNGGHGVLVKDTANTLIQGNIIGLNGNGTAILANGLNGVELNGSAGNTIGGAALGARNIISGNGLRGILIIGENAIANVVQNNYIGTDLTGAIDLGNTTSGVEIVDALANTIGGNSANTRNGDFRQYPRRTDYGRKRDQ